MANSIVSPPTDIRNRRSQAVLAETSCIMARRRRQGQAILANLRAYKAARQDRRAA